MLTLRSLLLQFTAWGDGRAGPIMLGAVITPIGVAELVPGQDIDVEMLFWEDEGRIHATVGSSFDIWYGRTVGHGTVTGLADELANLP